MRRPVRQANRPRASPRSSQLTRQRRHGPGAAAAAFQFRAWLYSVRVVEVPLTWALTCSALHTGSDNNTRSILDGRKIIGDGPRERGNCKFLRLNLYLKSKICRRPGRDVADAGNDNTGKCLAQILSIEKPGEIPDGR